VLGYVGARVVDDACVHLTLTRVDGSVRIDPSSEADLVNAITALVDASRGDDTALTGT
jgi:hypothetical protein